MLFRMIRLYDIKNTLSFPGKETSIDSGLPSHLPLGDVPCPSSPPYGFSIKQSDHTIELIRILSITNPEISILIKNDLICSFRSGKIPFTQRENMQDFERISGRIDSFRDEMIDMQIQLCALPAISPSSGGKGEAAKADILLKFLNNTGFEDITVAKAPDLDADLGYRPNILAYYRGKSSARTTWILCHMDVVPPGELSKWRGNPFKAWIEAGKIYGRGTEDNQQDMVASLFAIKAFHEEGLKPNYDVGIALVADEETGNEKGLRYVLNHSNPFRKQDLIVVPDAGNEEGTMIEIAEKSILWLKFKTYGEQAHGSTPEKGINSFRAASFLVTELSKLYQIFNYEDLIFDPPISTFEPTKKDSNVPNINTIPGEDVFYMDNRILPYYSLEDVEKQIKATINSVEKKFNVKIVMEHEQRAPAAPPTSPDAPVVHALKSAIKDIYKKEAKPIGIGGGTLAGPLRWEKFETACWSKTDETAHQPNEYCVIDNMMGDAKVFSHIFLQP
jgi:succinyl-diaminopimelate desuccinylase